MGYNEKMLVPETKAVFLIQAEHAYHPKLLHKGFLLLIPTFKEKILCP